MLEVIGPPRDQAPAIILNDNFLNAILYNNFAFGGMNTSLVLARA